MLLNRRRKQLLQTNGLLFKPLMHSFDSDSKAVVGRVSEYLLADCKLIRYSELTQLLLWFAVQKPKWYIA